MNVSRTASRRRASVTSRMTTIVSPPLGGLPTPTLTGYVESSIQRSGSARVGISTGPPSAPSGGALPSTSLSCSRISAYVRSSTSGKRRSPAGFVSVIVPSAAQTTTASPIARMTALSSAARACSAWARRWSRTWTSIRSRTSRAMATMARELPAGRPLAGRPRPLPADREPAGNRASPSTRSRSPETNGLMMAGTRAASAGLRTDSKRWPINSSRVLSRSSQAAPVDLFDDVGHGIEDDDRFDHRVEDHPVAVSLAIRRIANIRSGSGRAGRGRRFWHGSSLRDLPACMTRRYRSRYRSKKPVTPAGPVPDRTLQRCDSLHRLIRRRVYTPWPRPDIMVARGTAACMSRLSISVLCAREASPSASPCSARWPTCSRSCRLPARPGRRSRRRARRRTGAS